MKEHYSTILRFIENGVFFKKIEKKLNELLV